MKNGTIKVVVGDATEPQKIDENEKVFIPHICNTIDVWGGGFVIALSKKWGYPEYLYHRTFQKFPDEEKLSITCFAPIPQDKSITVCNMIAQDGIKTPDNPKPIKYTALIKCMKDVADHIKESKIKGNDVPHRIHCPKFGSLRAGGNWDFILELIDEIWLSAGIDVIVYEFQEK